MKKERYDLIFTLGVACTGTQVLREAGLQFGTLPFDWVGRGKMRTRVDIVMSDFRDWLKLEQLELRENKPEEPDALYYNRTNELRFAHDFPKSRSLEEAFPEVEAKYARRIARFEKLLRQSRKVLLFWLEDMRNEYPVGEADIRYCLDAFTRKYPKTAFRLLLIDNLPGVPPSAPQMTHGEGWERFGFDYRDLSDGNEVWAIRSELILPYLSRYSVRDYRPADVRREFERRRRREEYARFGAKTFFGCFITKIQYRIFKHLWKMLARKGVDVVRPAEVR